LNPDAAGTTVVIGYKEVSLLKKAINTFDKKLYRIYGTYG